MPACVSSYAYPLKRRIAIPASATAETASLLISISRRVSEYALINVQKLGVRKKTLLFYEAGADGEFLLGLLIAVQIISAAAYAGALVVPFTGDEHFAHWSTSKRNPASFRSYLAIDTPAFG